MYHYLFIFLITHVEKFFYSSSSILATSEWYSTIFFSRSLPIVLKRSVSHICCIILLLAVSRRFLLEKLDRTSRRSNRSTSSSIMMSESNSGKILMAALTLDLCVKFSTSLLLVLPLSKTFYMIRFELLLLPKTTAIALFHVC